MADYPEMYRLLFNQVTQAIQILEDVQRQCEELFVETEEEAPEA